MTARCRCTLPCPTGRLGSLSWLAIPSDGNYKNIKESSREEGTERSALRERAVGESILRFINTVPFQKDLPASRTCLRECGSQWRSHWRSQQGIDYEYNRYPPLSLLTLFRHDNIRFVGEPSQSTILAFSASFVSPELFISSFRRAHSNSPVYLCSRNNFFLIRLFLM